jgi:hypothetical protein
VYKQRDVFQSLGRFVFSRAFELQFFFRCLDEFSLTKQHEGDAAVGGDVCMISDYFTPSKNQCRPAQIEQACLRELVED